MVIIERHPLLRADEHKSAPEFKQKIFDLRDKSRFQIALKERLVLGKFQKLKYIRIADNIFRLCDLVPVYGKREDFFFVGVTRQVKGEPVSIRRRIRFYRISEKINL